mgnify:CR=1 FL=1
MLTRTATRAPNQSYLVAKIDFLTAFHENRGQVGITGTHTQTVVDLHHLTEATLPSDKCDDTTGRHAYGCTPTAGHIDT